MKSTIVARCRWWTLQRRWRITFFVKKPWFNVIVCCLLPTLALLKVILLFDAPSKAVTLNGGSEIEREVNEDIRKEDVMRERENALLQDRDKMQQVAREEGLRGVDNLVPPPPPRPCPSPGATGGWLDCSAPGKEGGGNQVWVAIHLPTVWNSDGRVLTEKKS